MNIGSEVLYIGPQSLARFYIGRESQYKIKQDFSGIQYIVPYKPHLLCIVNTYVLFILSIREAGVNLQKAALLEANKNYLEFDLFIDAFVVLSNRLNVQKVFFKFNFSCTQLFDMP